MAKGETFKELCHDIALQVAAANIDRAGAHELQVADDDILCSINGQQTRAAIALAVVASHLHNDFARVEFSLFRYVLTVRQLTSCSTAGAHTRNSRSIQRVFDVLRHIPLGAQAGAIDAQQRAVAAGDAYIARNDEVTVRTVEDNDAVLLDGVLNDALHIGAVGLQNFHLVAGDIGNRVGPATAASDVVCTGTACA